MSIIRRKVSLRHLIISCATQIRQRGRHTHTSPPTNSPEHFLQRCLRRSGASLCPKPLIRSHSHSPGFSYGRDCGFNRSGFMNEEEWDHKQMTFFPIMVMWRKNYCYTVLLLGNNWYNKWIRYKYRYSHFFRSFSQSHFGPNFV